MTSNLIVGKKRFFFFRSTIPNRVLSFFYSCQFQHLWGNFFCIFVYLWMGKCLLVEVKTRVVTNNSSKRDLFFKKKKKNSSKSYFCLDFCKILIFANTYVYFGENRKKLGQHTTWLPVNPKKSLLHIFPLIFLGRLCHFGLSKIQKWRPSSLYWRCSWGWWHAFRWTIPNIWWSKRWTIYWTPFLWWSTRYRQILITSGCCGQPTYQYNY